MVEIEEVNELEDLSVSQLKKRMKARGIDASGCTEKSDLIKRLQAAPEGSAVAAASTSEGGAPAPAADEKPDPMAQFGQLGRQLVMLPVLWGSNKIDWEDPNSLLALQVAFGVVIVTAVLLLEVTRAKVAAIKDAGRVPNPGTSQYWEKAEDGTVSIEQYDTGKVKETRTQMLMGGALCTFLHVKFGYTQPLLMTSIMNLFNLYDCKAIHANLFGATVERPWSKTASNPLEQWAEKKKEEAEAAREAAEKKAS